MMEKPIEEVAIEYAKNISKNETYQEYLKEAFLEGAKFIILQNLYKSIDKLENHKIK